MERSQPFAPPQLPTHSAGEAVTTMSAPILVTGMPRSGTTWTAQMLAAGGALIRVNEPLNPQHPPGGFPGILDVDVEHRFQYICADNEDRFLRAYRDMLRYRYRVWPELRRNRSLHDVPRQVNHMRLFLDGRLNRKRLLVADPYAVFSIPWFIERLGFRVVVVVRRPAATVSSRKRLGWRFDAAELRKQPLLVRDVLDPLAVDTGIDDVGDPLIGPGAQLWSVIHETIDWYRSRGLPIDVVRHEDLSSDPQVAFRGLYQRLGLPMTSRAARLIERSTAAGNPTEVRARDPHRVRLDSRANLDAWRTRLTAAELDHIARLTGTVARRFYDPDELS
jgi:hypothetical protein